MAEHPDHMTATGAASVDETVTDEILAVIAGEEPHGATAAPVAHAIGLGLNGEVVQRLLEELVTQGLLDRRRIGAGSAVLAPLVIRGCFSAG